jgi:hypothetical protein
MFPDAVGDPESPIGSEALCRVVDTDFRELPF